MRTSSRTASATRNPRLRIDLRNKWFITWGFLSCAGVPLLALIAGPIRGIPFYWRLIDCSFGVFCCLCLLVIRSQVRRLEALQP